MMNMRGENHGRRAADQDERPSPMGDDAAEAALAFLLDNAEVAGVAKAHMTYLEHFRKSTLARLKRLSTEKTDAAREAWARDHPEYLDVLTAQSEAIAAYETLYWRKTHAEATLDAWRTKNANARGAGRMQ